MKFLPSVVRASHLDGFRLHLVFNDRSENSIDFSAWLQGPVFEPLKDVNYFKRFFIGGGTVVWPNGADIAPEVLYEVAGRRPLSTNRLPAKGRRRATVTRRRSSRLRS